MGIVYQLDNLSFYVTRDAHGFPEATAQILYPHEAASFDKKSLTQLRDFLDMMIRNNGKHDFELRGEEAQAEWEREYGKEST